jgi:small-conductance mechanosensitive channel
LLQVNDAMDILNRLFYGNSIKTWLFAVGLALVSFLVLVALKKIFGHRAADLARRTANQVDDFAADLIRRTRPFFFLLISVYLGSRILSLPVPVRTVIDKLVIAGILVQGALWGNALYESWRGRLRKQKQEDAASLATLTALGFLVRLVLWATVLLILLENLGVNITALVAGLGVSGIAIALAVQNILGDLFASMSILLDKPFVIGDFITVDDLMGTVERVGLKTTRVRSLSGEQLVFANSDLLKSRIRNYQRMEERRVVFSVKVVYATPAEKLAAIPGVVREVVEAQKLARFGRSHFKSFGTFALEYENVYYVKSPDYDTYMDVQQAINLAVCRRFREEGIELARLTQSAVVDGGAGPSPSGI